MKKLLLSSLTLFALSQSALYAEGQGLYLGLGYANTNINLSTYNDIELGDLSTDSIVMLAGYDFNEYLGVEGRYYLNSSEAGYEYYLGNTPLSGEYKAESFALYAKPQYNIAMLNFYALLGVTSNDYTTNSLLGGDNDDTLFSWGAGVKFNITQSLGAFVDYTNLGESDNILSTTDLSSWNIGFSYKF
jgi:opacity protein-like surface antigen